jgi:hypothetical protein
MCLGHRPSPTLMEAKKWWDVALSANIRRLYDLEIITRW